MLRFFRRLPLSPLICFGLAWALSNSELAKRVEWRTLDWRTWLRVGYQPPADPRIKLVLFDDNTEANLTPWPPDRMYHGQMIEYLSLAHPKVITFDVILDAIRDGDGDAKMALAARRAMRSGSKVVTGSVTSAEPVDDKATPADAGPTHPLTDIRGDISLLFGDRDAYRPFPLLRRESYYGFTDAPHGPDGVQREIPLIVRIGSKVYPSLSLQTLMAYYDVPSELVRVRLGDAVYLPTRTRGDVRIPISEAGLYFLNYRYDRTEEYSDFTIYEYMDTMVRLNTRYIDKKPVYLDLNRLNGGIVFIGQYVTAKADAGPTPLGSFSPLPLVHANLVNNVLHNDYAHIANPWIVWLIATAVGYGGLVLGLKRSVWTLAFFTVLTIAMYATATFAAWIKLSLWLPFVGPLLGFTVSQFIVIGRRVLQEQHGREQIKQMFGAYVSPEVLKKMLKGGVHVSSERRPVSIVFTDLRDFTSLTETMGDEALILQLNEYLAAMAECIFHEGGTLHKFIGDAVMAVWGDIGSDGPAVDAAKAARAGLAMLARLKQLNENWAKQGRPAFRMGIGLNHGVVLIGNIGSPKKLEFAAIGDPVNLASRLESLNKELKTEFLVGESAKALIENEFDLRPCGSVPVKGKARPVEVFEMLGARAIVTQ